MTKLYTISEDIYEQVKQTIQQGLETNTRLILLKIDYLNKIIELLNEINEDKPFTEYAYYRWIINTNIKRFKNKLKEHGPGIKRMLLRIERNKDNEQYLMNCNLRVLEHIKSWNESYSTYEEKLKSLNDGNIHVLETFKGF